MPPPCRKTMCWLSWTNRKPADMPDIRIKICGLRSVADVEAVAAAGAAYAGFVFFAKSPRHLTIAQARELALAAPLGLAKVALVVNADDATPDRVAEIRTRYGLPVMKAVGVADESDLAAVFDYSLVADQILIDAKPPKDAVLPGGNGLSFDWRLVAQRRWLRPWMLAGGGGPRGGGAGAHPAHPPAAGGV